MKQLYITKARKLIQNKKELEDKLNVKIIVKGQNVTIEGEEIDEYFASRVIEALEYRFLVADALLLKDDNYLFEVINIKDHTHRHDFETIKGRLIGTKGKTLKVLMDLTNCEIVVQDNEVAIIGKNEDVQEASEAIISLIKGSKQGNVYARLEKRGKNE